MTREAPLFRAGSRHNRDMYAWRYLLLAIPSAGLLGPAALAWTLRRFDWGQAGNTG